jgi:uncharacterized membrane protein YfcA
MVHIISPLLISLLTIFANFINTLTGFGTGTIMIPILVSFFPLAQTFLFVAIIHWFAEVWKIILFRRGIHWRLIAAFGIPSIVGTYLGARLVFIVSQTLLLQFLGIFLIGYALFSFINPTISFAPRPLTAIVGGFLSGFCAGFLGLVGALLSVFLIIFDLPKKVYLATMGMILLIIDSVRISTYVIYGTTLSTSLLIGLFVYVPCSALGAYLAKQVVDNISTHTFRTIVIIFLLLIGIKLVVTPHITSLINGT